MDEFMASAGVFGVCWNGAGVKTYAYLGKVRCGRGSAQARICVF